MCMRTQTYHRATETSEEVVKKAENTVMLEAEGAEFASVSGFIYSRDAEVTSVTRGKKYIHK